MPFFVRRSRETRLCSSFFPSPLTPKPVDNSGFPWMGVDMRLACGVGGRLRVITPITLQYARTIKLQQSAPHAQNLQAQRRAFRRFRCISLQKVKIGCISLQRVEESSHEKKAQQKRAAEKKVA